MSCLIMPGANVIEYKLNIETNTFERSQYYTSKQIICRSKYQVIVYTPAMIPLINKASSQNLTDIEYLENIQLPSSILIDEVIGNALLFFKSTFYIVNVSCILLLDVKATT